MTFADPEDGGESFNKRISMIYLCTVFMYMYVCVVFVYQES